MVQDFDNEKIMYKRLKTCKNIKEIILLNWIILMRKEINKEEWKYTHEEVIINMIDYIYKNPEEVGRIMPNLCINEANNVKELFSKLYNTELYRQEERLLLTLINNGMKGTLIKLESALKLMREEKPISKIISMIFKKKEAYTYMKKFVSRIVDEISEKALVLNLDTKDEDQFKKLMFYTYKYLNEFFEDISGWPKIIVDFYKILANNNNMIFGDVNIEEKILLANSFIVLRYLNPGITIPTIYGVNIKDLSKETIVSLKSISRVMQSISNGPENLKNKAKYPQYYVDYIVDCFDSLTTKISKTFSENTYMDTDKYFSQNIQIDIVLPSTLNIYLHDLLTMSMIISMIITHNKNCNSDEKLQSLSLLLESVTKILPPVINQKIDIKLQINLFEYFELLRKKTSIFTKINSAVISHILLEYRQPQFKKFRQTITLKHPKYISKGRFFVKINSYLTMIEHELENSKQKVSPFLKKNDKKLSFLPSFAKTLKNSNNSKIFEINILEEYLFLNGNTSLLEEIEWIRTEFTDQKLSSILICFDQNSNQDLENLLFEWDKFDVFEDTENEKNYLLKILENQPPQN